MKKAKTTVKRCSQCRDGEHENYTDDVVLCVITAKGERTRRMYLCGDHRVMFRDDGYDVREIT